jgi:acyl carrier protein
VADLLDGIERSHSMQEELLERIQYIAADIFSLSANQITSTSSSETVEQWDSLQHLNLILALEEEFGVQFTPRDIENMLDIEAIISIIQEKLPDA